MLKKITAEEKAARIKKQRETAARNRRARAERQRQQAAELAAQKADIERAREICREIRDKPDASDADKLRAIELLQAINDV